MGDLGETARGRRTGRRGVGILRERGWRAVRKRAKFWAFEDCVAEDWLTMAWVKDGLWGEGGGEELRHSRTMIFRNEKVEGTGGGAAGRFAGREFLPKMFKKNLNKVDT